MKKVLMIATGGTIASKQGSDGLKPELTAQDVVDYIPSIKKKIWIDTEQLFNLDSTNISQKHWLKIAEKIEDKYEEYDGFVICHGTDTMAYTAAALSYLIQNSTKPIVLTGSQKPIDLESTDARGNLHDAIVYAGDENSCGVQIVFSNRAILGTRARKINTKSLQAFDSINYPAIAFIQDDTIIHYIALDRNKDTKFYKQMSDKVALIKIYPGINGDYLQYYLDKNDAVIVESYGVGGLPILDEYKFAEVIEKAVQNNKTIVFTTQVQNEGSDMSTYQVGNYFKNLKGILEAYDMTSEAVITKLMWILSLTNDQDEISKLFYTPISNDILFPNIN